MAVFYSISLLFAPKLAVLLAVILLSRRSVLNCICDLRAALLFQFLGHTVTCSYSGERKCSLGYIRTAYRPL
jgi:hypothetical protein